MGCVKPRIKAKIIMLEEEKMLWNAGILGSQVPKQLVEMLLYLFGLHFALRTGSEHRSLRAGPDSQLQIKVDNECGLCYLKYTEDSSKNNPGGIKYDKKIVCAYKNKTMLECCVCETSQPVPLQLIFIVLDV